MIIFKISPVLLSDNVSTACGEGLVNKETPLIKTSFKPTNHSLPWISHFKMNLLIDFITNIIKPMLHKNDLVNIIQLCEEKSSFIVMNWFQVLKNFNHKLLVLEIGPGVVAVSVWTLNIRNAEVSSKVLEETFEQEVSVNSTLDFDWKLFDNVLVSICRD